MASTSSSDFFTINLGTRPARAYRIPAPPTQSVSGASVSSASAEGAVAARWLKKGQPLSVGNFLIPGGLIYTTLCVDPQSALCEPSLINTWLKLWPENVDSSSSLMTYWPDYKTISAQARRGYVQWLAEGRCDPRADIGYVFIFFYGLERRALIDTGDDQEAIDDLPDIIEAVEHLLGIYGSNSSLRGYAESFLDYLGHSQVDEKLYLHSPPVTSAARSSMPMGLRVGLGQMAINQYPVNGQWALAWALSDPDITRRTPATRCPDLLATLFIDEFERVYPDGIVLSHNKTKLKHGYRTASRAVGAPVMDLGEIPDVTASSLNRKKLQFLLDRCSSDLDGYSRFIGRYPENAQKLEGLLQLPISLWPSTLRDELERLKARIEDDLEVMTFADLGKRFNSAGVLSRPLLLAMARALESLQIGMEPDVLAGSRTPKPDDCIALFVTLPDDGALRATPAYNAACLTLDLASAVTVADGKISAEEVSLLLNQIDAWQHLSIAQRKRLKAHLGIQLQQPPTLVSLKSRLEPLAITEKQAIAHFLASLAQADGCVSAQEVKLLERVYKVLQLDPQSLYGNLHVATASRAFSEHFGVPLTTPEPQLMPELGGVVLNLDRIALLQRETEAVSALLAKVFTEEPVIEPEPEPAPQVSETQDDAAVIIPGLEGDHLAFLRLLLSRPQWSRSELEDSASDMELMLDGALEHINELAYEHFDMPITEGEEPVEINPDILEKLAL